MEGAGNFSILLARHSSPSASPTSCARLMSKDEPRPVEEGKQLEGTPLKTAQDPIVTCQMIV